MYKDADLAYFAGLLDGEGSFELHSRGVGAGNFFNIGSRLSISSTTPSLLYWVEERFGGNIRRRGRPTVVGNMVWHWSIDGQKAVDLIEYVRPFLVEKQTQAWLLQEYWASRKRSKGPHCPPTDEDMALRHGFVDALRTARHIGQVKVA